MSRARTYEPHWGGNGNGTLVKAAKIIGIVCGAIVAAATVAGMVVGYIQRPLFILVQEERQARQTADSLMIIKLDDISHDVAVVGSAINEPFGAERGEVLKHIRDAPHRKR